MNLTYSLYFIFACALANRIRGGWLGPIIKVIIPFWGTTLARLMVSSVISIPVFMRFDPIHALVFLLLLFVGFIWGWGDRTAMKNPKHDVWELTKRGLLMTFAPGVCLLNAEFALCGIFMGLYYYLGLIFPIAHKQDDGLVWAATESGEIYYGALLGYFVLLATNN